MQADLDISPERWGWVVGAFTIAYAAFEIPSGALGDRIGARKVLTRIVIWWSAFTTFTGLVSNYFLLLVIRFLFGAGEAGAYPNTWVWMASRIGGGLTPLLVIPIQQRYGWRASFWLFGSLGLVWAVIWFNWYRDHPSQKPGVTRWEMEEIGAASKAEAHHQMPWGLVFRSSNLWTIMVMYHLYCWGAYFYLSWLHTYLQKGREFTENQMALWSMLPYAIGAVANMLGGLTSDRLVKRYGLKFGRRSVGAVGLGLSAFFILATALTASKTAAAIFLALGFGCMDFMLPVAWAVCLDIGKRYAGAVTGAMNMAGQVGSFLTAVVFGYMVKIFNSYNAPLIPMSGMLFVSALLFLKIDPTRQLVPEEAPTPPSEAQRV
jgi:MFS family permease